MKLHKLVDIQCDQCLNRFVPQIRPPKHLFEQMMNGKSWKCTKCGKETIISVSRARFE